MLLQDNATRWNSTYLMIDRALRKQPEIDVFCDRWTAQTDENRRLRREDRLTPEDWRILTETHAALKPFYLQTQRFQSRAIAATHGSLWEAFPAVEFILNSIEEQKRLYEHEPVILEAGSDDDIIDKSRKHLVTA
jgi:hypothetical protein